MHSFAGSEQTLCERVSYLSRAEYDVQFTH
jgi:hypothetical protein